jgi:hypothetical protein
MSHAIRVLVSNRESVYSSIRDVLLCPRKERGSTDEERGSVLQSLCPISWRQLQPKRYSQ